MADENGIDAPLGERTQRARPGSTPRTRRSQRDHGRHVEGCRGRASRSRTGSVRPRTRGTSLLTLLGRSVFCVRVLSLR